MRALPGTNLLMKLKKLMYAAGMNQIDFDGKFAAIKIHFGEPGNLSFLRPNFSKVVADTVKELGLSLIHILVHFVLPALTALLVDRLLRRVGWVKEGYMKLDI